MLNGQIDEAADDAAAMTPEQAAQRVRTLEAEILAEERAETFWIDQAAAAGTQISYRSDINPRALLELA